MTVRLSSVASSAAAALGVTGYRDELGLGEVQHAVIVLIDGLGWHQLVEHRQHAPVVAALAGGTASAPFPTTTPVGIASLGTGLEPGGHGLVGASFWLPEEAAVLTPLHWGSAPHPLAVQPEPTVFETAARSGIAVASIGPAAYANSGLTRAVLRGADYLAAEGIVDRAAHLRAQVGGTGKTLSYVYWPQLDRLGHEHGVGSAAWLAGLRQVDHLVEALLASLPPATTVVITADHGMVNAVEDERIAIESIPALREGVAHIAGEPRARHVYARPGAAADVAARWHELLDGRAQVSTRDEVLASGILGDVDPALVDRLGDVVAVALGGTVLASRVDPLVSSLIGQHGALTDAETQVPALVHST